MTSAFSQASDNSVSISCYDRRFQNSGCSGFGIFQLSVLVPTASSDICPELAKYANVCHLRPRLWTRRQRAEVWLQSVAFVTTRGRLRRLRSCCPSLFKLSRNNKAGWKVFANRKSYFQLHYLMKLNFTFWRPYCDNPSVKVFWSPPETQSRRGLLGCRMNWLFSSWEHSEASSTDFSPTSPSGTPSGWFLSHSQFSFRTFRLFGWNVLLHKNHRWWGHNIKHYKVFYFPHRSNEIRCTLVYEQNIKCQQ